MRQRSPGLALFASVTLFGSGCAVSPAGPKTVSADHAPSPPVATKTPAGEAAGVKEAAAAPAPWAPASERSAPRDGGPAAQQAAAPNGSALAPSREMLDIEARVTLQVPKVKRALKAMHELAARLGAVITEERVDTASESGAAQLTLRIPSGATQSVFDQLEQLGNVLDQNVSARDVGKEYFDANLRLSSLEATLHRYEEILTHAKTVEEILRIEQELARIRGEIEQVKGNLRWLSDR